MSDMSRERFLLPLLAVVFILGACHSEGKLTGEVFIVTKGRDNIEMGLVNVKAIAADSVENHLERRYNRAQRKVKTRASEIGASLDSLADLSLGSSGVLSADLYTLAVMGSADVGDKVVALPKGGEIELGKTRRGYVTLTEPTTGTLVSKVDYGFYEVDFGGYSGQVKGDNLIRLSHYRNIQESKEIEDRVEEKLSEVERYISQSYYYRDMPSPHSSSETGSDGNYELTVEGVVPYYLIARASRLRQLCT
jgi:ribosome-associated translation inhibitor RaiA